MCWHFAVETWARILHFWEAWEEADVDSGLAGGLEAFTESYTDHHAVYTSRVQAGRDQWANEVDGVLIMTGLLGTVSRQVKCSFIQRGIA